MSYTLHHADCLDIMRGMSDNSIDAVVTDPPYFKVKGEAWDRQWDNPAAFLAWMDELCEQWHRILKPNGSLYVFASPQMAARVECKVAERFNVLQRIVWAKPEFSTKAEMFRKPDLRSYFPVTEYIIFAEHYGADNIAKGEAGYVAKCDELRGFVFEPLRAYLYDNLPCDISDAEQALGWTSESVRHCFLGGLAWWRMPTKDKYTQIQKAWPIAFLRAYEDLRREYEDLRREYEDLRRPFAVSTDVPYTDVWTFPTVQARNGKHPCEKPLAMMRHIISASTKPGAVVLDCFAGSGVTLWAARELGRSAIGIEKSDKYYAMARDNMETLTRWHTERDEYHGVIDHDA